MGFRFLRNLNPIPKCCLSRGSSSRSLFNLLKISCVDHGNLYSEDATRSIQRRWHGGLHNHLQEDRDTRFGKESENIFRIGLAADISLAVGKAVTGYLSGSTAIIADAAHSVSDVVLSGVALLSFNAARNPKDKEHPYGHGKFESLGALGISSMLLVTAGGIAWHAFDVLQELWFINHSLAHGSGHIHNRGHHHGMDMDHPVLALNMTLMSIAVKEGLYWMTKGVGERTGSGLMIANAWHHRADAVSSVVALIGVGGSIVGVRFLDPLAGLFVSGLILKAGIEGGYNSIMELVDAAVPSDHLKQYKETISAVQGVKGHKHLRGRRAGSSLYLDVDVEVDPFSSVSEAHDIGEYVRRQVQLLHPEVAEVFIHIEPENSHVGETDTSLQKVPTSESSNMSMEPTDTEETVSKILASKFSQEIEVQKITRHSSQGHVFLEIEVTMSGDALIREAAKVAEDAQQHILEAVPNIKHVSILLRLGHPMPGL